VVFRCATAGFVAVLLPKVTFYEAKYFFSNTTGKEMVHRKRNSPVTGIAICD
jgi:hypothetical protein